MNEPTPNGHASLEEHNASKSSTSTPTPTSTPTKPVICVFCGASPGSTPTHLTAARSLAHAIHAANASLVYGGGTLGLMGEVAKTLVSLAGPSSVHGIIPQALVQHEQGRASNINADVFGRSTVVPDMHTRKRQMAQEVTRGGPGGGFVALSGGFGTMEELMEVTTWNQLGIHNMPVVVFNVDGYWDGLIQWVNKAIESGFIKENCRGILMEARTAEEVMECLNDYKPAEGRLTLKWEED